MTKAPLVRGRRTRRKCWKISGAQALSADGNVTENFVGGLQIAEDQFADMIRRVAGQQPDLHSNECHR